MGVKITNNAAGTLSAGITNSATTLTVTSGQGALFPTLTGVDYCFLTLVDTSNNVEIVKCTARSTDSFTIVRAQDNTTARAFAINDRLELRPTAALFDEFANPLSEKGSDIASANPLVITAGSDYFDVTGTTNFSAMTVATNRQFTLQFDGVLTMTHHATNLDLPGEANITTAAGDVATFQSTGANTVQCINYTRADGTAIVASSTTGIDDNADATAITIDSNENVGIGHPLNTHTQKLVVKKNFSATTPSSGVIVNLVNEQGAGNFASIRFTGTNQNAYLGYRDGTTSTDRRLSIGVGADSEHFSFTSNGLTFNGDTASANALSDYEEGTWNPTLTCTNSGSYTLDSSADTLAYTKIGRTVHIQGGISITGRNSENGYIRMTLPFTPMTGTDDSDYAEGSATLINHGGSIPNGIKIFVYGDTHAYFRTVADNGTGSYITHADTDAVFQMRFSFTYIAA
jgi:hypothetical protein